MADALPADRQPDRGPDRHRQLTAARALVAMLDTADAASLPPLTWTVDSCGAGLHGETDSPADMAPQATIGAWVAHLGMTRGQASVSDGRKQIRAVGVSPSTPAVPVEIMADIPRDLDTDHEDGDTAWKEEGTPWLS